MRPRFLRSRGVRKFRRNRMAMACLGVISVYFAVALFVLVSDLFAKSRGHEFRSHEHPVFGMIVTERTAERVAVNSLLGVGGAHDAEKRAEHHEFYLSRLERALESEEPERSLSELRFAELGPLDAPVEELQERLDGAWELFDELDEIFEEVDELYDELDELDEGLANGDGEADASRLPELEAEIAAVEERIAAKVDEIGAGVEQLFPVPDGFRGAVYRLRTSLGTDRQVR